MWAETGAERACERREANHTQALAVHLQQRLQVHGTSTAVVAQGLECGGWNVRFFLHVCAGGSAAEAGPRR
jgi:hypothetical protein